MRPGTAGSRQRARSGRQPTRAASCPPAAGAARARGCGGARTSTRFSAAVHSRSDAPVRRLRVEANMTEQKWTLRWNSWISPTKVPGVFRRKEGGYLVRGRTKDPATGKDKEVRKALDVESEALALKWLEDELERVRSGASAGLSPKMRFADYALSLAERKLTAKEIKSARGRERWKYTLEHLIGGTEDVTGLGELFIDEIRPTHIEAWRTGIARLIGAGTYAPTTTNGWLI